MSANGWSTAWVVCGGSATPEGAFVPVYQYACTECGSELEVRQSFTDDALTDCPTCEGRLRKVLSAVGVVFKGSGFYRTDSRAAASSGNGSGTTTSAPDKSAGDKPGGDKAGGDKAGDKRSGEKAAGGGKDGSSTSGASKDGGAASSGSSAKAKERAA
jgi:putative FmdB family regulatory protein